MLNFSSILLVAIGGMMGTLTRYFINLLLIKRITSNFPWATFAVNILGSFLIGLFLGWSLRQSIIKAEQIRLFLMVGFCGGFTTLSAMSNEGFLLLRQEQYFIFFIYFTATILFGVAATAIGYYITK